MQLSRLKPSPLVQKVLLRSVLVLVIVYVGFGALIWRSMCQTPEQFGHFMARLPGPVPFLLYPFESMWMRARAGTLGIGAAAPDFLLTTLDKTAQVQLSSLNKQGPVVLVFGSYT